MTGTTTAQRAATTTPRFGAALKAWRARRRLSQMELALTAGVSPRHVAFLETGRSQPSREMVIALAAAMDVPLAGRNDLMHAAGFAPAYRARPLSEPQLAPIRAAIDLLLANHAPYPGILLDRHWKLLEANPPAAVIFGPLLGDSDETNLVRRLLANPMTPELIVNWPEVARELLARLRLEAAHAGGDPTLDSLIGLLASDPVSLGLPTVPDSDRSPVIGVRIRTPLGEIALFSALVQFGTPDDITVRDLRLELFFPQDATTEKILRAATASV